MAYYNEVFDTNGALRPHYGRVYGQWKKLSLTQRRRLHRQSAEFFAGEYSQDPLPRILTNHETQFLRRGVEQRARAISAFLYDYSSRGSLWRRVMPEYLMRSIMARHHRENFLRQIDPESIAFPYGPDVIRDAAGVWRIVEDSAGFIGGIGDLLQNRKTLFKLVPQFRTALAKIDDPIDFYQELAGHYLEKAKSNDGIPVLYLRDFRFEADQETRRLADIFKKTGIECARPSDSYKKLIFQRGGTFLRSKGSLQRVGALILHAGPEQLEAQSLIVLLEQLRNRKLNLKSLMLSHHAGLLTKSLVSGKMWTNFSPGVQFVNDKVFGLYVNSMIRKFLVEEPVLKTIPSQGFSVRRSNGEWPVNKSLLAQLRRDKDRFVVKKVDEDGGEGVWIGLKESKESLDDLIQRIRVQPADYIMQEFEHLSVLENRIVDLRIHAHVDRERIIVSNTPWGRANWIQGDGKVNISAKGFGSPVVVFAREAE
jgi:uncharacterized circularly permuted ATP-grasp superfamily protein